MKALKVIFKILCWYVGLTWTMYAASISFLNGVRKSYGKLGDGEEIRFRWAWLETADNVKEAIKIIEEES